MWFVLLLLVKSYHSKDDFVRVVLVSPRAVLLRVSLTQTISSRHFPSGYKPFGIPQTLMYKPHLVGQIVSLIYLFSAHIFS